MELPDDIRKRLRMRGHKSDWVRMGTRLSRDSHEALVEVCFREKWNIENVLDYLVEGFVANYRTFWPEDGMLQTQLVAFNEKSPVEITQVDRENIKPKFERTHPDYLQKIAPILGKLSALAKEYEWSPELERQVRKIAAETNEEWSRNTTNARLDFLLEHLKKKPIEEVIE
jgi:hypothetical protein